MQRSVHIFRNHHYGRAYFNENAHLAEAIERQGALHLDGLRFEAINCHIIDAPPDTRTGDHSHEFLELSLILDGHVDYALSCGQPIPASAGDQFAMPPTHSHRWSTASEHAIILGFMLEVSVVGKGDFLPTESLYAAAQDLGFRYSSTPQAKQLHTIIREALANGKSCDTSILAAYLNAFQAAMLQPLVERARQLVRPTREQQSDRFRRAVTFIDTNLAGGIQASDVAWHVSLSVRHLNRLFITQCGQPVGAFVQQRRMERAKECLRHLDSSIQEVALACGYSSASYFSTAFRKATGMSPATYAKS